MTFRDLPSDWPTRSLRDPVLAADVVDLVVRDSERADGCLTFLLCDRDGRMIQPVTITDTPIPSTEAERLQPFGAFLGHLGGALGALVVAVGKPHGRHVDDDTRAWHETALTECRRCGVDLISTWLVTADAVTELPTWEDSSRLAG